MPLRVATGLMGGRAGAGTPVSFVVGVITFEPARSAVAFKGGNVRGDSIQEPAVVTDHNGAARKMFQRFFESAKRVYIEVVCRFVQQQNVGSLLQHLGKMHPVPLPARQSSDFLLLICPRKIEPRNEGPRIDLP